MQTLWSSTVSLSLFVLAAIIIATIVEIVGRLPLLLRVLLWVILIVYVGLVCVSSTHFQIRQNPVADHRLAPTRGIRLPQTRQVVLCLSGGGYRAMLFHAGVLWRLNEAGMLPKLDTISSVSGGSITAAVLAKHWHELDFDERTGVASNFEKAVIQPLLSLADRTIDIPAIVTSVTTPASATSSLVDSYRKYLFGNMTLLELPSRPRFIFHSTNLLTGRDWIFSKDAVGDNVTRIESPELNLAVAVAASSAFPPFLSPLRLDVDRVSAEGEHRVQTAALSDGGVFDNLGVEGFSDSWLLVSDGSGHSEPTNTVPALWPLQIQRVVDLIYDQPNSLRRRSILTDNCIIPRGVYWSIRSKYSGRYKRWGISEQKEQELYEIPTRLQKMPDLKRKSLVKWGYISASWRLDDALKSVLLHADKIYPKLSLE